MEADVEYLNMDLNKRKHRIDLVDTRVIDLSFIRNEQCLLGKGPRSTLPREEFCSHGFVTHMKTHSRGLSEGVSGVIVKGVPQVEGLFV